MSNKGLDITIKSRTTDELIMISNTLKKKMTAFDKAIELILNETDKNGDTLTVNDKIELEYSGILRDLQEAKEHRFGVDLEKITRELQHRIRKNSL